MIYLLQSESKKYLKIRYTKNLEQRLKTYKTHNPEFILINSKEGTRADEVELHKLCNKYHYDDEWFYYNDEVISIFDDYVSLEDQIDIVDEIRNLENHYKSINDKCDSLFMKIEKLQEIIINLNEIVIIMAQNQIEEWKNK